MNAALNFNYHQQALFRLLLITVVVAGTLFIVINSYYHMYYLVILQLPIILFSLFLWFKTKSGADTPILRWLYMLAISAILGFMLAEPNAIASVFLWCYITPGFAYILLGKSKGFIFTGVFYIYAVMMYFHHIELGHFHYQTGDTNNIIISALVLWGGTHLFEHARELAQERLIELASKDTLTGLHNRFSLSDAMQDFCQYAQEHQQTFSMVIFDVDFFKQINDRFGHDNGDKVLKRIANTMRQQVDEKYDKLFRLGGEEFLVLYKNCDLHNATRKAQQVLDSVAAITFNGIDIAKLTLSAGVAEYRHDGDSLHQLYSQADIRLYQAKASGRNCVINSL